jgi:hypothetical protein
MSERQADSAEPVVITASDLAGAESSERGVLAGSLLTLCLPLLCGASIVTRIALRGSSRKTAWTSFLCTLLLVSGLMTSVATACVPPRWPHRPDCCTSPSPPVPATAVVPRMTDGDRDCRNIYMV